MHSARGVICAAMPWSARDEIAETAVGGLSGTILSRCVPVSRAYLPTGLSQGGE